MDIVYNVIKPTKPDFPLLLMDSNQLNVLRRMQQAMPNCIHAYEKAIREKHRPIALMTNNMDYGLCNYLKDRMNIPAEHVMVRIMSYYDICKVKAVGSYGFVWETPYRTSEDATEALTARIELCKLIQSINLEEIIVKD